MGHDTYRAVRDACLWLPEAEEHPSHGAPNFRVRSRSFASYMQNHHGDGRVALWLASSSDARDEYVGAEPQHFFVPPYVGTRGWLGVRLDRRVAWTVIVTLVRQAYELVAPAALARHLSATPHLTPPLRPAAGDLDPLRSPRGRAMLKRLRDICLPLPGTHEQMQFGHPVWRAGKKTYAWLRWADDGMTVLVWVGVEQQGMLVADRRFRIPPYLGHNGWIALDVTAGCDVGEVRALIAQSYRHFALKRMLACLPSEGADAAARASQRPGNAQGPR